MRPSPLRSRSDVVSTVLRSVAVCVVGVLPAFLVGALTVQLRADIGIGLGSIGLATAFLFAVAASLARFAGGLVQRVGSRRGIVLAALLSTTSLMGAGLAQNFATLLGALLVGGLGNAMAQPAANLGLSEIVTESKLGLAFGIKQSAIPAATLVSGLTVPSIALVLGWRWVWAAAAVMALAVACWAALAGRDVRTVSETDPGKADLSLPRSSLLVLTIGGGLATGAATSLGVFLVGAGVVAGLSPGHSGLLFAASSLLGLTARIGLGWLVDRHPTRSRYALIANLLICGAGGYALLALGLWPAYVAGSFLAYGAGWAWTGLFHFAIVKDNRQSAALATGFVQTGLSLGAALGPLGFGVLAESASYSTAWLVAGAASLTAAVIIRLGRRMIRQSRGLPVGRVRRRLPPDALGT